MQVEEEGEVRAGGEGGAPEEGGLARGESVHCTTMPSMLRNVTHLSFKTTARAACACALTRSNFSAANLKILKNNPSTNPLSNPPSHKALVALIASYRTFAPTSPLAFVV